MGDVWECEVCNYWEIMHKVGNHEYREGQFEKCKNCTRQIRLKAYKEHWDKRTAEG
jgi:hypothetical protein